MFCIISLVYLLGQGLFSRISIPITFLVKILKVTLPSLYIFTSPSVVSVHFSPRTSKYSFGVLYILYIFMLLLSPIKNRELVHMSPYNCITIYTPRKCIYAYCLTCVCYLIMYILYHIFIYLSRDKFYRIDKYACHQTLYLYANVQRTTFYILHYYKIHQAYFLLGLSIFRVSFDN